MPKTYDDTFAVIWTPHHRDCYHVSFVPPPIGLCAKTENWTSFCELIQTLNNNDEFQQQHNNKTTRNDGEGVAKCWQEEPGGGDWHHWKTLSAALIWHILWENANGPSASSFVHEIPIQFDFTQKWLAPTSGASKKETQPATILNSSPLCQPFGEYNCFI